VAQLEVPNHEYGEHRSQAEICVLHAAGGSRLEWGINRAVPIVHGEATAGEAEELMRWWEIDAAVPVGCRLLAGLSPARLLWTLRRGTQRTR